MRHGAPIRAVWLAAALLAAGPASLGARDEERARPHTVLHTVLLASYPAADSTQREEIREIRLRYSTAVQSALSTITLTGPSGVLPVGAVEAVAGSQEAEIRVSLRAALPSGTYRVDWRTAGPDGHPIMGSFGFAVERSAPADPSSAGGLPPGGGAPRPVPLSPNAASGEPPPFAPTGLLVRSLFFASLLGMLGTVLFRLVAVAPLARDPQLAGVAARAAAGGRTLAWVAAGLALVALPARLVRQSSELFGAAAFQPASFATLLGTGWGAAWYLELGAAALFVVGLLAVGGSRDRIGGWLLMLMAALGAALVPALSGHAVASAASVRPIAVLNDALHVTAAGAWLGTLGVLLMAGLPATRAPAGHEAQRVGLPPLARMVNAFSRMAVAAVAVLIGTGAINAWLRLGSLGALVASDYGRALLVKLALVAAAAAVGFYNWRVLRPALVRDSGPGPLSRSALVEVTLGVAVVIATAVLVGTPPP